MPGPNSYDDRQWSDDWLVAGHGLTADQVARWRLVLCGGADPDGTSWPGIPNYDPIATREDTRFSPEAADVVFRFFPSVLRHIEGDYAGRPFELERWQQAVIGNLFGWLRPNGRRRYRETFVYVPRKNGKTTLAAGIALYMLVVEPEKAPRIFSIASTKEQAAIVFEIAKAMVDDAPKSISSRLVGYQKSIRYRETRGPRGNRGFWQVLASDATGQHGHNASTLISDELHTHKTRDMVDAMTSSMGARTNSLQVHLSTADHERESVCNEKHDYAHMLLNGTAADVAFLPVIWEAAKADDWAAEETWRTANPNFGAALDPEFVAREALKAAAIPGELNKFLRLQLNIRTQQAEAWLSVPQWDVCEGEIKESDLKRVPCFGGLDLSANMDVTAFTLLWPLAGRYAVRVWYWMPEESIAEMRGEWATLWGVWKRQGRVNVTPGGVVDYESIRRDLTGMLPDETSVDACLWNQYSIREVAVDFTFQGIQLSGQLSNDGLTMVPHRMNAANMTGPCHRLEVLLAGGKMLHEDDPILRWMVGNVSVYRDAGGRMFPRKRAKGGRGAIDGVITTLLALSRADVYVDVGPVDRITSL